jgi:hypothetical protein
MHYILPMATERILTCFIRFFRVNQAHLYRLVVVEKIPLLLYSVMVTKEVCL